MDFFTFSDPNVRMVTLGAMLLGLSAATVGSFTFLRKRALVGDAIAHAILPGVCLAFIWTGEKHPAGLLLGAVVAGWVSLLAMDFMTNHSKLKTDTAIGAVLSVFFGLGILLLTAIQHSGSGNQSGLDQFLFGKAASMTARDVWVFGGVALVLLLVVLAFFKEFKLVAFDPDFARTIGLPVRRLEFVLATITVLSVATGIQAVGVVLMAALLITPAAAARFWTDNIVKMVALAAVFGMLAGLFGAWVSYTAPAMPTGPWIVMLLSVVAVFSLVAAPERGIWARVRLQQANARKMLRENILKAFFQLAMAGQSVEDKRSAYFTLEKIKALRPFQAGALEQGLRRLKREGLVEGGRRGYRLTVSG
ncbi:MAG: iron chelate uptake ABC transporter family permease subunit, partial [Bacteroidetes bacterium]|nr:iron chelate uptake ABC transporter family permease subunit [Bacteroidota bacterium]